MNFLGKSKLDSEEARYCCRVAHGHRGGRMRMTELIRLRLNAFLTWPTLNVGAASLNLMNVRLFQQTLARTLFLAS
jgi:hypothetical protein